MFGMFGRQYSKGPFAKIGDMVGGFTMLTVNIPEPEQFDAETVAFVGFPCQRMLTAFVPCPVITDPLFGGLTLH